MRVNIFTIKTPKIKEKDFGGFLFGKYMSLNKKERAILKEKKLREKRKERRTAKQEFDKLIKSNNWIDVNNLK